MKKLALAFFGAVLVFPLAVSSVKALTMDYIGGLSTAGTSYSHWWYTGLQPRIGGTTTAGFTVDVTVGDQSGSVPTDADGNWWWDPPAAFSAGDHAVTIADGADTISFTLTLGSGVPAQATASGTAPETGTLWPTLLVGLAGSGLMAVGGVGLAKNKLYS